MTKYVRVNNDSSITVLSEKPKWYSDGGIPLTDQWFIENEKIYPLIEPHLDDINYIEKSSKHWKINSDNVEKTYYTAPNDYPPIDNLLLQKYVLNPKSQWIYDDNLDTVTISYSIQDR